MSMEHGPQNKDNGDAINDIDFNEITDENLEQLVEALSVPVEKKLPKEMGESIYHEVSTEAQERLAELAVENFEFATRWQVRQNQDLFFTKYGLDDVHWEIYQEKRSKSRSPFVSVDAREIIQAGKDIHLSNLQRVQTVNSYLELSDMGLRCKRLYRMASSDSSDERFQVRSLARLLQADCLDDLRCGLPGEAFARAEGKPITFEEVVTRAIDSLGVKYRKHIDIHAFRLSKDERIWHQLELRNLKRTAGFASPLATYNNPELIK